MGRFPVKKDATMRYGAPPNPAALNRARAAAPGIFDGATGLVEVFMPMCQWVREPLEKPRHMLWLVGSVDPPALADRIQAMTKIVYPGSYLDCYVVDDAEWLDGARRYKCSIWSASVSP